MQNPQVIVKLQRITVSEPSMHAKMCASHYKMPEESETQVKLESLLLRCMIIPTLLKRIYTHRCGSLPDHSGVMNLPCHMDVVHYVT